MYTYKFIEPFLELYKYQNKIYHERNFTINNFFNFDLVIL